MQAELATDAAPALVKGTASLKLTIVPEAVRNCRDRGMTQDKAEDWLILQLQENYSVSHNP